MYPVEYHLKKLMLDYDCVTVPGLGGFILQPQPAWINRGKNRIHPPSRSISFNSLLSHDDGLLISALAKSRQVSYREAGIEVAQFAGSCKSKLASGGTVLLDGIGELSTSPEGQLRFSPSDTDGFHNGVYGMTSVSLYTRAIDQKPVRLEKKPSDRKTPLQKEKKPGPVKWTLAVSLPIILFLLYGIIFPQSVQNVYRQYTGFMFILNLTQMESGHKASPAPLIAVAEPVVITEPVIPEETKTIEDAKTIEVQTGPKYYIIGGCFESPENAGKFLSELTSRGFEAEEAGTTGHGHVRISYKSFSDKSPALSYLQEIRGKENPSAWLLKY